MVTYGSVCLISFLHHFGSDPSYRPSFKSRWYISLFGFLMCVWLMFQINPSYAILAMVIMTVLYLGISSYHKDRNGFEAIFQGAVFQLSRRVQVFLQKKKREDQKENWRPAAVCVSRHTFERDKAFNLLNWLSYKFGFGTYIHFIEGYYSKSKNQESKKIMKQLIDWSSKIKGSVYVDTIISPSYTSAIAQILQLPSPSGMDNNMIILEYNKHDPENLKQIIDNIALTQAGEYDVLILGSSTRDIKLYNGIHVWIRRIDRQNASLMILLSYIILGHPDWEKGYIKIFDVCTENDAEKATEELKELVLSGRLPITEKNVEVIVKKDDISFESLVNKYSQDAGLTIVGFKEEQLRHEGESFFEGFDGIGDVLFVDANNEKQIN